MAACFSSTILPVHRRDGQFRSRRNGCFKKWKCRRDYALILPNESVEIGIDIPSELRWSFARVTIDYAWANVNPHTTQDCVNG